MPMELPEERLLNLIKSKSRKAAEPKHAGAAKKHLSLPDLRRLFDLKAIKPRHLLYVNKLLTAAAAVSLVYLFSAFIFPYKNKHDAAALPLTEDVIERPSDTVLKDYSAYSRTIGAKKLFFSETVSEIADVGQSSGLSDRFSLVGIVSGDNPQAVIEDKKAGKTYYLYKGASFNGTVVEDIGSGRVILDCKGERISLVL